MTILRIEPIHRHSNPLFKAVYTSIIGKCTNLRKIEQLWEM